MEIPVNALVKCSDGDFGRSEFVLIDPVADKVTDLVVKEAAFPNTEFIVPLDLVTGTVAETIQLRCSQAELKNLKPFIKTKYVQEQVPGRDFGYRGGLYGMGTYYFLPYASAARTVYESVEKQQVPPGALAVSRGTRVEAKDGYVGKVDEFVVNPENGHVTHLVMREGHLWGKKDVIIPLSALGDTHEDTVFLKLDKHQIGSHFDLPIAPKLGLKLAVDRTV